MTESINRPVALLVSRGWAPDMESTRRVTFLASSRPTMFSRSPTDLASLSNFVTVKCAFAAEIQSSLKLFTLGDRRDLFAKILSHPAARSSRSWASRPATWRARMSGVPDQHGNSVSPGTITKRYHGSQICRAICVNRFAGDPLGVALLDNGICETASHRWVSVFKGQVLQRHHAVGHAAWSRSG